MQVARKLGAMIRAGCGASGGDVRGMGFLVLGLLVAGCGGEGRTEPDFTPDFPLSWVHIGHDGEPTSGGSAPVVERGDSVTTYTYTLEIQDARDRPVPGVTVIFDPYESTVTPEQTTSDEAGRLTVSWSYVHVGRSYPDASGVYWCFAYQKDCNPDRLFVGTKWF
jgi:hypothetical protein